MRTCYILIFIAWTLTSFQLFSVFNYGVTAIDILLGIFYLLALKHLVWNGRPLRLSLTVPVACMLALVPAALLSGLTPVFEGVGFVQFIKTFLHFVFVWLFAVLAAGLDDPPRIVTRIIQVLMVWGLLVALFGIYQVIARAFDLPLAWLEITNVSIYHARDPSDDQLTDQLALQFENFFRATSIFSEPSILASFTSILLMFLGVPYFQGSKPFFTSRALNWLFLVSYVIVLLLTFSLTGFASMMIVCGLVFLLEKGRRKLKLVAGLLLIAGIVVSADGLIQPVTKVSILDLFGKRLYSVLGLSANPYAEGISGESFETRKKMIETGVAIWSDYPLAGVGIGRFSQAEAAKEAELQFSVSSFFSVLAELGSLGMLLFCGMFVSLYYLAGRWRRLRHDCSAETARLLGLLPYIMGLLTLHNLTGNSFVLPGLWIFVGIFLAVINSARAERGMPRLELRLVALPWKDRVLGGRPDSGGMLPEHGKVR